MFLGQLDTMETKSQRFYFDDLKSMLDGSTFHWDWFQPASMESLIFSVEGGQYDGALLNWGVGVVFSIIPTMTNVSLRKASSEERIRLAPYVPESFRQMLERFGSDPDKVDDYWTIIECLEGTWFIWSDGVAMAVKEIVMLEPSIYVDGYRNSISRAPLWDGGPPLTEL